MRRRTITVLVAALAFFAAAPRVTLEAQDSAWRRVTLASELTGYWEGAVEMSIPANAEAGLPKSAMGVSIILDYADGAPQVKATMRVDMARFLDDFARTDAARAQGITQDMIWAMMEEQFSQQQGITVGGKYFLLGDISDTPEQMLGADSDTILEINAEATQLRLVFHESVSFGLGDAGFKEIVLNKTAGAAL